jgi:molybdopterin converting factor small subunit
MKILAFGQIAEVTQKTQWELEGFVDLATLKQHLHTEYPSLASMTYLIAVNHNVTKENTALKESDTVALLPPFSGG